MVLSNKTILHIFLNLGIFQCQSGNHWNSRFVLRAYIYISGRRFLFMGSLNFETKISKYEIMKAKSNNSS